MDEMIEKVAKAIDPMAWSELAASTWRTGEVSRAQESARAQARAAIEAMRLPTDAMIESADRNVRPDSDNLQCPNWYTAAIDAALSTPLASEGGTDAA